MNIEDYIEEIEPTLSKDDGQSVIRCVCEISKLLTDIMPQSGKYGIEVAERFLSKNATPEDLLIARVEIWKDHDENHKDTPQGEALRVAICALFFPIGNEEYSDTLHWAVDFSRSAKPSLHNEVLKSIIEREFRD